MKLLALPPVPRELAQALFGDLGAELVLPEPRTQEAVDALLPEVDLVVADWSGALRVDDPGERVRFVQVPSVGTNSVDLDGCARRGVPVANTAGANTTSVAEWAVGAALAVLRGTLGAHEAVVRGEWPQTSFAGQELRGRSVGVVGMGDIGRECARLFDAFGCDVRYWSRSQKADAPVPYADLDDLLTTSDVVVLVIALGPETRHLVDATRLKEGAVLVNGARGEVVDESTIPAATQLRGIALDVFSTEPLPAEDPLRQVPHLLLSPHMAGGTQQAAGQIIDKVLINVRRVLAGEAPVDVVNGVEGVRA